MERSSASVGSGIFRCRSGCRPGGRGWLNPKWVPIRPAVAAKSLSGEIFFTVFCCPERVGGQPSHGGEKLTLQEPLYMMTDVGPAAPSAKLHYPSCSTFRMASAASE